MKFLFSTTILSLGAFFAACDDALTFSMPGVLNPKEIMYQDNELGNYNTTSCSGAPSCGATMASYNGVPAKSNGVDQCTGSCCGGSISTGCAYQCVELAQRYMHEKHGIAPIWYDNANMMCSSYPKGISKTSNPQPGDLWVRTSGTYGHVAVITAVHSSTVDVLEQNSSPSGKNTYNKADAGCFLTATGSPSTGSCSNLGEDYFRIYFAILKLIEYLQQVTIAATTDLARTRTIYITVLVLGPPPPCTPTVPSPARLCLTARTTSARTADLAPRSTPVITAAATRSPATRTPSTDVSPPSLLEPSTAPTAATPPLPAPTITAIKPVR
jgi:surface antigen